MLIPIEMILEETILEEHKITRGQNFRGGYRSNYRNDNF